MGEMVQLVKGGEMIKVGIVGCGFGAKYHGKVIVENFSDKFKLIAFCDINKEKLEKTCSEFNVKGYTDFDQFIENREIELVVIATRPHSTHFPLTIKALKSGKNVIVEKPMCIKSEEAKEMIKTRNLTNKILTIHQSRRWDIDFLNIKQIIEEGKLGKLKIFKSYYPYSFGEIDAIYEWGSHLIDQILYLFGLPKKVLGNILYPFNEWDKMGYFSAILLYKENFVVEVGTFPQAKPFILPRFYILGEKGSLIHDWVQRREDSILKHMHYLKENKIEFDFFSPKYYTNYKFNIPSFYENVYDAIKNGKELIVKAEDGLKTVLITEKIIESSRKNQFLEIDGENI